MIWLWLGLSTYVAGFVGTHIGIRAVAGYHDVPVDHYSSPYWADSMGIWMLPLFWPLALPVAGVWRLGNVAQRAARAAGDRARLRATEAKKRTAQLEADLWAANREIERLLDSSSERAIIKT